DIAIAVLGVLKAGGAYVPLDPDQPAQRLTYMVQDADCQVLLTHKHLVDALPAYKGQVVCLDADWALISQESELNLPSNTVTAENLAYLIYTSGSTGQAKGVMVKHSSLVNAYLGWEQAYQLRSLTCHLQMANFSFDVFAGDLIRALCSGAKLVICPRDLLLESEKLYALMRQQKVDSAEFVPVVLNNLIQYLEKSQQSLDFMQLLICGSDSWYGAEYNKTQSFIGKKTRLINSFGLTETTIDSSYYESYSKELTTEHLVPIGRPFINTQIYILDSYLQPVPIGVC
ncbi:MAG TPA: non-ribosomal peptide synthetase, partial [Cyanobacteria bacterium UBA11049]|nr:non-ribosomal peptide synthetase [Cyanobacteria bacterium UBA11049]